MKGETMNRVSLDGEVIEPHLPTRTSTNSLVRPVVGAMEAVQAFKEFHELAQKVLGPEDEQVIGGKRFKKKSAWRKFAQLFNISVECIEEKFVPLEDGMFAFDVRYRASAPNGRSAEGDGSCECYENDDFNGDPIIKSRHDTRSTAHTRAFNRAVSNLIGFGEVSAEEINSVEEIRNETAYESASQEITLETKFRFGKYKGKTIKEVGFKDAFAYLSWLEEKSRVENRPFKGQGKAIFDFLVKVQQEHRAKKQAAASESSPSKEAPKTEAPQESLEDLNPFDDKVDPLAKMYANLDEEIPL